MANPLPPSLSTHSAPPPQVVARGREPLCHPCLHEQLLAKVRHAARVHGLVQPGDRLALAFSGGRASAALLRFLALLRNPRTDRPARGQVGAAAVGSGLGAAVPARACWSGRRGSASLSPCKCVGSAPALAASLSTPPSCPPSFPQAQVSYSLHIIHVDKSAALGRSPQQAAAWAARVAAAVQPYLDPAGGGVQYHRVPLEAAFSSGSGVLAAGDGAVPGAGSGAAGAAGAAPSEGQAEEQLRALLAAVRDVTGRSDLVRHLRTHVLLRAAAELGCGRLARGDCATALATHIVAAASKGCGYSLPGDVHLLDDRQAGGQAGGQASSVEYCSTRRAMQICAPHAERTVLACRGTTALPRSAAASLHVQTQALPLIPPTCVQPTLQAPRPAALRDPAPA